MLGELLALLPEPESAAHTRGLTRLLLLDAAAASQLRQELARLLRALRRTTAAVCGAIERWRDARRSSSGYFASLPPAEVVYMHSGENYVLRMAYDAAFLPLPIEHDPLLLDWFGGAVPWITANVLTPAAAATAAEAEATGGTSSLSASTEGRGGASGGVASGGGASGGGGFFAAEAPAASPLPLVELAGLYDAHASEKADCAAAHEAILNELNR